MAISYSNFLEISITASLMIAAILLFRVIFKRAPRWVFCLMWGIVAIRLVLPVSLESRFSLLPEKEVISNSAVVGVIFDKDVIAQDVLSDHLQNEGIGDSVPDNDNPIVGSGTNVTVPGSDIQNEQIHSGTSDITVPGDGTPSSPGTTVRDEDTLHTKDKGMRITVSNALFAIWITGVLVLTGYFAVSSVSIRLRLNTATLLYKNIKQSENIKSPFVMGIFFPKIYLPYKMDVSDMTYVLAHEKAHISRGDHITKVIAFALLSLYWFNPLVWAAYVMFCRDIELACDEKVVKSLDISGRRAYSYALLNCSVKQNTFAGCPVAFGEADVRRRVKGVMGYKKPTLPIIATALASCILASLCLMTYPVAQAKENTDNGEDNFDIENNDQVNEDQFSPTFVHTNRGLTITTTESEPTDGKYTDFRLIRSDDKYVDFSGEALAEYPPYVYYKAVAGDEDPSTPESTECGSSKIIVNFVTEHSEDTHKEEVHIFDAGTLKEHDIVDVGSIIADEIALKETKSHYIFNFLTRRIAISKDIVENRNIDLSGDLIFDSNYRYYPALVGTCSDNRDFVCEMLWREADGDAFARVEIKFYFSGSQYIISSAELYFVDSPNARLSRCNDIDILNQESNYPKFPVSWYTEDK